MKFLGSHTISAGRTIKLLLNKEKMPLLFDNLVKDTIKNGLQTYLFSSLYVRQLLSNRKEEQLFYDFDKFPKQVEKISLVAKEVVSKKIEEYFDFQINIYKDIVLSLSKDFGINELYMSIDENTITLKLKTSSVSYRQIWLKMNQDSDILKTNIFGVERKTRETYKFEELPFNEYPKNYFTKKGLSSKYPIKFLPIRDKFFESIKYTIPKQIKKLEKSYQDDIATAENDFMRELNEKWYKEFLEKYKTYPKTVTFTSAINPYKFEENTVVLVPRFGDFNEKSGWWDYVDYQVFENGNEQIGYDENLDYILNHYLNITYQAWEENEKN